jgi:hypothetical protein
MDNRINFGIVQLSSGISSTDTTVTLASGHGDRLPTPPFNMTIYNNTLYSNISEAFHGGEAEIVRVTNKTGDNLIIVRAQEGTTAQDFNTEFHSYFAIAALTKKMIDDIETEFSSLESQINNISSGMTAAEKATMNDMLIDIAENAYQNGLNALNYQGGMYDIFADETKIDSDSNVSIKTLENIGLKGYVSLESKPDLTTLSGIAIDQATRSNLYGSCFFDNGYKIAFIYNRDSIYFYTMTKAYDLRTVQQSWGSPYYSFSFSSYTTSASDIVISQQGNYKNKYIWITNSSNSNIYSFYMSVYGDPTSIIFNQTISTYTQDTSWYSIYLNKDNTKLYLSSGNDIYEYTLGIAGYLSSSVTYVGTISTSSLGGSSYSIYGMCFSDDGKNLYLSQNKRIYEFTLSTAWSLSTASYSEYATTDESTTIYSLFLLEGFIQFLITGNDGFSIYSYDLETSVSSGNIVSVLKDLSDDGFSSTPTKVVVSLDYVLNGETISAKIIDANSNEVSISESNFDSEVSLTGLSGTVVKIEITLSQTGGNTPTLYSYAAYFKE